MKRENVTLDALTERIAEAEKEFDAIPARYTRKENTKGR